MSLFSRFHQVLKKLEFPPGNNVSDKPLTPLDAHHSGDQFDINFCLCDNYSLHNVILCIINNVVYLNRSTCRQHQKKLVNSFHYILSINDVIILSINDVIAYQSRNIKGNQYRHLITFLQFIHFVLDSFDSSHGFSANQKHAKIQILSQTTPTYTMVSTCCLLTIQKSL